MAREFCAQFDEFYTAHTVHNELSGAVCKSGVTSD